ncbi:MAG: low-specificity L-threonine aldolase [Dehalococcoidia bacterium]
MTNKVVDLRSDTVTMPTPAMRQAIAEADLGDDVWREDPTVNRLEAMAAKKLGKEAALLTASGTMSNLVALLTHCQRGDEVLLGNESHIFHYEVAGAAALGGLELRLIPNDGHGRLHPKDVEEAIRLPDIHHPRTGLVCLENTHNRCGGAVLSEADMEAVAQVARRWGIPVHLDGARIFNAAVALGVPAADLARPADSVAFSLCKGLACPVGSVLCGSGQFIERARKYRKMVGGGMRQAGIIAAAGIVALESMIDRLQEDHDSAKLLAQGLLGLPLLRLDPASVQSNMVSLEIEGISALEFLNRLAKAGVLVTYMGGQRLRLVTHYGIGPADIEEAIQRIKATASVLT